MANVNKTQLEQADLSKLYDRYTAGSAVQCMGVEIEQWLVNTDAALTMMTPTQSQAILKKIADGQNAAVFVEENGVRKAGLDGNLPIVFVDRDGVNYQLELCGVLEAATEPVPATNVNRLLSLVGQAADTMRDVAATENLTPYPCAVPASVTIENCADNMVQRERLRAEWAKFSNIGADNPGLRTMGLATSVQVSIGYRDVNELRELITLGNYLSPLLTAAFSNTTGYVENAPSDQMPRPSWWLQHNDYAPRGGIPAQIATAMQNPDQDIVKAWFDYVTNVPMVYYYEKDGSAAFERSPTFNELQQEGNGTATNFALAESLTWPDVKLIGGQRVELRMCDSGPWQAKALTLISAALFTDPAGRAETMALLKDTGITMDGLQQSRKDICTQGLDTTFGKTTLRDLLPSVMQLAVNKNVAMGVDARELESLQSLIANPVSDTEALRGTFNKSSNAVDMDRMVMARPPTKLLKTLSL